MVVWSYSTTTWGHWSIWICLCSIINTTYASVDEQFSRIVKISQGPVRGYKDPENDIYSFQSIPYASAPTGPNKFKAPLPPPSWTETLEAVDKGIICPQAVTHPAVKSSKNVQENCLIANVYVPVTEERNFPVLVYVHGGAFQLGFGNMLVPKKLVAEHDIIVVTFNYRLGAHGFLCLGTEDIPGNAGMKDQVALLRWVKDNIASFGGNPKDVTIAGFSAGSASVDLLMLAKSAEGLFNKVIPESGANIAAFSIQPNPIENAKSFAKNLKFARYDDIHALENFYKTLSFDLLTINIFMDRKDSTFVFSPCVERATAEEVFLDQSPVSILKSGEYLKPPMLYGFADMEGLLRISLFDGWKNLMNENFAEFLPADLKFDSEDQKKEVANMVKKFYFGDKNVAEDNVLSYVDYFTDVLFAYPVLRSVNYHVEAGHNNIYLYEYSYVDGNTPPVSHTNVTGANHCAQSVAVFGGTPEYSAQMKLSEEFLKVSSTMRTLWSNFIKTGKPVSGWSSLPAWPAVGEGWSPHMAISSELRLRGPLLERRARFWDGIYSRHYREPLPPQAPAPLPTISTRHVEEL